VRLWDPVAEAAGRTFVSLQALRDF
jgi:hypothetical protein